MSPVNFWQRDVDQARTRRDVNTSGVRPSWDPQDDPNDRYVSRPRFRDLDGHDLLRDEQAYDPFGEGVPGALPPEDLQDLAARSAGASGLAPSSPPAGSEASPSKTSGARVDSRAA